jgi:hypothetical protein
MSSTPISQPISQPRTGLRSLPRNIWATGLTSFFTDISSEMILNILPLFMANVLGIRTSPPPPVIGLIEGIAEATSSLLKVFSGWFSDRLRARKGLAVAGYALSAFSKPFFYFANSWGLVAAIRWADRVGKGIRTAPRDALVADSVDEQNRGLAFGFHRAADTAGALVGILIALLVVWLAQRGAAQLSRSTFQTVVLISIIPGVLGVLTLALGALGRARKGRGGAAPHHLRGLGRRFALFMLIVGLFDLGNSSDAFLIPAGAGAGAERGRRAGDAGDLQPGLHPGLHPGGLPLRPHRPQAGHRRRVVGLRGIYLGVALARSGWQVWLLYALYGVYYGMAYGTTRAMVADIVPPHLRGTAYGTYNAMLGILDFPASFIAGVLWQGVGPWQGFGPSAPFLFAR